MSYEQERGNFRFIATGQSLISRRIQVNREKAHLAWLEHVRAADAAFTNLEVMFHNFEGYPAAVSGGTYAVAPPRILDELTWAGFNIFACANNHSGDYGTGGILATLRHLEQRDITFAGIGRHLADARAPGYLETGRGRVALVALSTTFGEAMRAGDQRPDTQGRPGLNPLRFQLEVCVTEEEMASLRNIANRTGSLGLDWPFGRAKDPWFDNSAGPDTLDFLGVRYRIDHPTGIRTYPHSEDLKRNIKSINDARDQADWVFVSVHSHENSHHADEPAPFLVDFAHQAIDAGAHAVIGHGAPYLKGIEIYRGRPIFYSLGNLFFQNDTIVRQPAENFEIEDLSHHHTVNDYYNRRIENPQWDYSADNSHWETVMADIQYKAGSISELRLIPLTLGQGARRGHRGRPLLAENELAEKIIDTLGRLSKPYGTEITYQDGLGVVRLG